MQLSSHQPLTRKKGFSLIEILISITVVSLIAGVGAVSYRDFNRKQQVVGAARNVIADIRLAQNEAFSGKKPSACTGTLAAFMVRTDTSAGSAVAGTSPTRYTRFITEAVCVNPNTTTVIRTTQLPTNTSFIGFPFFAFKTLGSGTVMTGSAVNIDIYGTGTSFIQRVTVTAAGEVR